MMGPESSYYCLLIVDKEPDVWWLQLRGPHVLQTSTSLDFKGFTGTKNGCKCLRSFHRSISDLTVLCLRTLRTPSPCRLLIWAKGRLISICVGGGEHGAVHDGSFCLFDVCELCFSSSNKQRVLCPSSQRSHSPRLGQRVSAALTNKPTFVCLHACQIAAT